MQNILKFKTFSIISIVSFLILGFISIQPQPTQAASIAENVKGRILLQVQQNGEAWYVNPDTLLRYYMGRPKDAFELMRSQGLGITNADIAKIPPALQIYPFDLMPPSGPPAPPLSSDLDRDGLTDTYEEALGTDKNKADTDGDGFNDLVEVQNGFNPIGSGTLAIDSSLVNRLKGKILLKVQGFGEAWYVNPVDGKRYFLGRPTDAFSVMRTLGLGITDEDLSQIIRGDVDYVSKKEGGKMVLYQVNSNGSLEKTGLEVNVIMTGDYEIPINIVISPDKTKAIFNNWEKVYMAIFVADIDGGGIRQIAQQEISEGSGELLEETLTWSADGKYVTYIESGVICGENCKGPDDFVIIKITYRVNMATGEKEEISRESQ